MDSSMLKELRYPDLQRLAKRNNIPANLKRDVLVERLSKVIETGTPLPAREVKPLKSQRSLAPEPSASLVNAIRAQEIPTPSTPPSGKAGLQAACAISGAVSDSISEKNTSLPCTLDSTGSMMASNDFNPDTTAIKKLQTDPAREKHCDSSMPRSSIIEDASQIEITPHTPPKAPMPCGIDESSPRRNPMLPECAKAARTQAHPAVHADFLGRGPGLDTQAISEQPPTVVTSVASTSKDGTDDSDSDSDGYASPDDGPSEPADESEVERAVKIMASLSGVFSSHCSELKGLRKQARLTGREVKMRRREILQEKANIVRMTNFATYYRPVEPTWKFEDMWGYPIMMKNIDGQWEEVDSDEWENNEDDGEAEDRPDSDTSKAEQQTQNEPRTPPAPKGPPNGKRGRDTSKAEPKTQDEPRTPPAPKGPPNGKRGRDTSKAEPKAQDEPRTPPAPKGPPNGKRGRDTSKAEPKTQEEPHTTPAPKGYLTKKRGHESSNPEEPNASPKRRRVAENREAAVSPTSGPVRKEIEVAQSTDNDVSEDEDEYEDSMNVEEMLSFDASDAEDEDHEDREQNPFLLPELTAGTLPLIPPGKAQTAVI